LNGWLQENRLIVDPLPGTTRDATSHSWAYKGRKMNLVDTAGLEKAAHFKDAVDKKIQRETLNAIRYSQVVVLVIDGYSSFRT
jgi:GTP-binding protein